MTAQQALNLIDTDDSEDSDSDVDIFCDDDDDRSNSNADLTQPEFTVGAGDLFPDWTGNLDRFPSIPDFTGHAGLTLPPNIETPLQLYNFSSTKSSCSTSSQKPTSMHTPSSRVHPDLLRNIPLQISGKRTQQFLK